MKLRSVCLALISAILLVSCSWVIVDPRVPAVATATNVARHATMTAEAVAEGGEATATATLMPSEVITEVQPTATGACIIKGNVNSAGEKIFEVPGQLNYNRTIVDESKGERWFCTEEQALEAGWRKAKR